MAFLSAFFASASVRCLRRGMCVLSFQPQLAQMRRLRHRSCPDVCRHGTRAQNLCRPQDHVWLRGMHTIQAAASVCRKTLLQARRCRQLPYRGGTLRTSPAAALVAGNRQFLLSTKQWTKGQILKNSLAPDSNMDCRKSQGRAKRLQGRSRLVFHHRAKADCESARQAPTALSHPLPPPPCALR